jgi:hypothetical protein
LLYAKLYSSGSQPGAREHYGAIFIPDSALSNTVLKNWEVPVDTLCLCSLAKSKTTVVLVDEQKVETPCFTESKKHFMGCHVFLSVCPRDSTPTVGTNCCATMEILRSHVCKTMGTCIVAQQ